MKNIFENNIVAYCDTLSFATVELLLVPLLNAFCVQLKFKTLTNIKYQPFTQPQG